MLFMYTATRCWYHPSQKTRNLPDRSTKTPVLTPVLIIAKHARPSLSTPRLRWLCSVRQALLSADTHTAVVCRLIHGFLGHGISLLLQIGYTLRALVEVALQHLFQYMCSVETVSELVDRQPRCSKLTERAWRGSYSCPPRDTSPCHHGSPTPSWQSQAHR